MRPKPFYKILLLLTAFILLGFAAAFIPVKQSFVFIDNKGGDVAAYAPLEAAVFKIKYTHTIHLSDVIESYKVMEDGQLMMTELEYEDFNIGMPSNAGKGEIFVEEDGKYFIRNMKTVLPEFRLFIGDVDAGLSFILAGRELDLKETLVRGQSYTFRVQYLSLLQQLKGVNLYER